MALRTVLIEDEKDSLFILKHLIQKNCPNVEIVAEANSVATGIDAVNTTKPDLIFLDIAMPDGEGFEVLENSDYQDYQVIFTTAYDHYALKAFEYSALHYLLKPIQRKVLLEAVSRVEQAETHAQTNGQMDVFRGYMQNQKNQLILPTLQGLKVVKTDRILWCESDNNYTTFHFKDGSKIMVSKPIHKYEELLDEIAFCRIHNRYIVNLAEIKEYIKGRGGYVILDNEKSLAVSEGRRKNFLEKLNKITF